MASIDLPVRGHDPPPADRRRECRCVVIAVVDGGVTVKQLCRIPDGILLRSGANGHRDILISGDQELSAWGVVRWSIHQI